MRLCVLLLVALLLVGCNSYYRVTDPQTGRVYYADKKPKNKFGGAVTFEDMHRATKVTLQSSEVTKVSKGEANAGRPPWEPIEQDPAAKDRPR